MLRQRGSQGLYIPTSKPLLWFTGLPSPHWRVAQVFLYVKRQLSYLPTFEAHLEHGILNIFNQFISISKKMQADLLEKEKKHVFPLQKEKRNISCGNEQ